MGVLACDRPGCDNIMCDYVIHDNYVCYECVEEFKRKVGDGSLTKIAMAERFEEFIVTHKSQADKHTNSWEADEIVTAEDFCSEHHRHR